MNLKYAESPKPIMRVLQGYKEKESPIGNAIRAVALVAMWVYILFEVSKMLCS